MFVTYYDIMKLLKRELEKQFDHKRFNLYCSKNEHFHFTYRYKQDELDTDEKIKQMEQKLSDCANDVYETLREYDLEFNRIYNPASRFISKDTLVADFIVLYRDID